MNHCNVLRCFPQMRVSFHTVLVVVLLLPGFGRAEEVPERHKGRLLIIGGGLRRENSNVYERMIADAGGRENVRFGILPTASATLNGAASFAEGLKRYGVGAERVQIIDLTLANAARQAISPQVAAQIRGCTALFLTGGDQRWITRALLKSDGSDTPALAAIREVWQRGGLIAGSSAGAAAQSEPMISVSGLPDESLDEGMDALDFGLTQQADRRGLLVTRGLGFFRSGVVDQHFSEYRGRLGRLARATIEQRLRYGFGVDENTAMAVEPAGTIEVMGAGNVTIVDAEQARCEDGPLGCRITGVSLSLLSEGDRFDPSTGVTDVPRGKAPTVAGAETNNGNYLIPDIAGEGAVWSALVSGLGDNTSRKQVGITLRYNQHFGHGYRFTFTKTERTRCFQGYVNGVYSYSVLGVRLDVEPIDFTLRPPQANLPLDLPSGASRKAIEAMLFRGILLADEQRRFRPDEPITRAELAGAIAQTIRLEPPRRDPPVLADVPPDSPWAEEITKVVAARLMSVDDQRAFRPADTVPQPEAATIWARLSQAYRGPPLSSDVARPDDHDVRSTTALTRSQAAEAINRIVGFPW
jgi:cyanophycinase